MKNTRRFISAVTALTLVSALAPVSAFALPSSDDTTGNTPTTKTLDAATASNSTDVNYSVDPSYTVIIPAKVALSDTAATPATISLDETAKPFKLGKGQTLKVNLAETNDFKVTNADLSLDYTITAGSATLKAGDTAAAFTNDDKTAKTITFSQMDATKATYAGDYTGTLTFSIAVENAAPKYADQLREASQYSGDFDGAGFWDLANETFNGKTITQAEAQALAAYQKQQTGINSAVFYDRLYGDLYYITDDGTTGKVWWHDTISNTVLNNYKLYVVND